MKKSTNYNRYFSEALKQEIVKSLDLGKLGVTEVSRIYEVSRSSVYLWWRTYSKHYPHQTRMVMEKDSADYQHKQLQERIKELEAIVGNKQIRIDYLEKLIEIAGKELGVDIEKKGERRPWSGSDKTKKDTPGR